MRLDEARAYLAAQGTARPTPITGRVHSWDLSTGVDGPGTRFVLFLSGCPLRCLYCQNPDTWFEHDGAETSVDNVLRRITRYCRVFERTGGGVTVSGGEPLLQPKFTAAIFRGCVERGIPTALDTDLVLLDIKSYTPTTYTRITGSGDVTPILRFARHLAGLELRVWIRFVLVPGLNDAPDNIEPLADFVAGLGNVERVDVLPFHALAIPKYDALGLPFPLAGRPLPTPEDTDRVRWQFAARGLTVT